MIDLSNCFSSPSFLIPFIYVVALWSSKFNFAARLTLLIYMKEDMLLCLCAWATSFNINSFSYLLCCKFHSGFYPCFFYCLRISYLFEIFWSNKSIFLSFFSFHTPPLFSPHSCIHVLSYSLSLPPPLLPFSPSPSFLNPLNALSDAWCVWVWDHVLERG